MRTFLLRDLLSSDDLRALIARLRSLPSVPALYAELSHELNSDDASLRRIGEIIGRDVAMTAKVLQLANSAYFGVHSRIVSAEQAVQLMGVDMVRSTLLSTGLVSLLDGAMARRFRLSGISRRGYAVTGFVRLLAKREGLAPDATGHALTAAMLHDAGRLVLASCIPDEYGGIVDCVEKERRALVEVEQAELGCTHAEVGAYLLGLWGLADEVTSAVAWHHRPSQASATG